MMTLRFLSHPCVFHSIENLHATAFVLDDEVQLDRDRTRDTHADEAAASLMCLVLDQDRVDNINVGDDLKPSRNNRRDPHEKESRDLSTTIRSRSDAAPRVRDQRSVGTK